MACWLLSVAFALFATTAHRTLASGGNFGGALRSDITVRVGNLTRHALLHVPASVKQSSKPAPLVLNWHGMMETPQEQQGLSDFDRVSDAGAFILAYPQGGAKATVLGHSLPGFTHNGGGCCSSADSDKTRIDDVAFARALVDAVDLVVPVDRSRVYSTGFSNGGFMSYRLGCQASDVFAAVAVVSAVLANHPNLAMGSTQKFDCQPPRTVPLLHIHGTKDELVTYTGNPLFGWPAAEASAKAWAARNGCHQGNKHTTFENHSATSNSSVRCVEWCGGEMTNVTICTIQGGTHAWPAGRCGGKLGACTLAIPGYATLHLAGEPIMHASDEIWRFFKGKRLPTS